MSIPAKKIQKETKNTTAKMSSDLAPLTSPSSLVVSIDTIM
jgi:hypothetical protein